MLALPAAADLRERISQVHGLALARSLVALEDPVVWGFVSPLSVSFPTRRYTHVTVNGRRVTIPSYLVREGDVVEVRERSKTMAMVLSSVQQPERDVPDYLSVDLKALKGTLVREPKLADVPYPVQMEPNLVIEYYSR